MVNISILQFGPQVKFSGYALDSIVIIMVPLFHCKIYLVENIFFFCVWLHSWKCFENNFYDVSCDVKCENFLRYKTYISKTKTHYKTRKHPKIWVPMTTACPNVVCQAFAPQWTLALITKTYWKKTNPSHWQPPLALCHHSPRAPHRWPHVPSLSSSICEIERRGTSLKNVLLVNQKYF